MVFWLANQKSKTNIDNKKKVSKKETKKNDYLDFDK